jgi:hypothetical protein
MYTILLCIIRNFSPELVCLLHYYLLFYSFVVIKPHFFNLFVCFCLLLFRFHFDHFPAPIMILTFTH